MTACGLQGRGQTESRKLALGCDACMLSNVCGFFHIPRMRWPTALWSSSKVRDKWLCDDEVSSEMKMRALSEHQMLPEHYCKACSARRNASTAVCNISSFYKGKLMSPIPNCLPMVVDKLLFIPYFLVCRNPNESLQCTFEASICVFAIALSDQRELKNGIITLRPFTSVP